MQLISKVIHVVVKQLRIVLDDCIFFFRLSISRFILLSVVICGRSYILDDYLWIEVHCIFKSWQNYLHFFLKILEIFAFVVKRLWQDILLLFGRIRKFLFMFGLYLRVW